MKTMVCRATCRNCGHVRIYNSSSFYDERCKNCDSLAFGLRKTEYIRRANLPADAVVYHTWDLPEKLTCTN